MTKRIGKMLGNAFERIVVAACYRSVGRNVPPEIQLAMKNGTPFKVSVLEGQLFASIDGVPLINK